MWGYKSSDKRGGVNGSLPDGGPCLDFKVESFGSNVVVKDFLE